MRLYSFIHYLIMDPFLKRMTIVTLFEAPPIENKAPPSPKG